MPRVSVIIPTYNGAAFVAQAIESALTQTFKDLEVIVIDDGSTDDTAAVVAPFGNTITYIQQENRGQPATRNRAITESHGEYIAFLDNDDWWEPSKIEQQVAILDARPKVGIVYTDLKVFYDNGRILDSFLASRPTAGEGDVLNALLRNCFILPSTVLLRRECLRIAGLFDPTLRSHEDYELWIRICLHWQVALLRQPLTNRRQGTHNVTNQIEARVAHGIRAVTKVAAMPQLDRVQRAIARRELARAYFDHGYHLFSVERLPEARASLLRSVTTNPRDFRSWRYLLLSALPLALLQRLRRRTTRRPVPRAT